MQVPESVVLLDNDGRTVGSAPKSTVHARVTPLHRGFSCYLLDEDGLVLATRRALSKQTWPGTWTNSFCGHPAPGERDDEAVRRRARQELGAEVSSIRCLLPDFRYRAVDANGIEENELCPVFIAQAVGAVTPDPTEVMESAWLDPRSLAEAVSRAPFAFSPWMVDQLATLTDHGILGGNRR